MRQKGARTYNFHSKMVPVPCGEQSFENIAETDSTDLQFSGRSLQERGESKGDLSTSNVCLPYCWREIYSNDCAMREFLANLLDPVVKLERLTEKSPKVTYHLPLPQL